MHQRPAAETIFSGHRRALTIGLLMAITLVAFEALAVATVMPRAEQDLGGLTLYGWAFSGFLLASIVGITWAGEQADRRGPGAPLAVGMTLFGIGLLIAGLAPSMLVLVIGRAIQGLGAGALPAIAYVALGRGYPEHLRPRMLAMFASAWVVPGLVGPAIGGAIAEFVSWRGAFLLFLPLIPVMAVLTLPPLFCLGPPGGELAPSRVPTSIRLALAAGLALGGVATGSLLWGAPLVVAGLVFAVPALRRLLPPGTFRAARGLPAAVAGNGFLNMCFFGAEAFIPYLLTTHRGYSAFVAGLALTSATLSWTAGSWIQERAVQRISRPRLAAIGVTFVTLGIALVPLALFEQVPGGWVAVAWAVGGLGMGIAYPMFSLELLASSPPGREGEASASMKLNETLSAAAGVGIAGGIVAAGDAGGWPGASLTLVFALAAAVGVLTALISLRLTAKPPAADTHAPERSRGPLAEAVR
jgi:MFS family permease